MKVIDKHVRMAEKLAQNNDQALGNYTISFCDNNYVSPAKAYLSYVSWTGNALLEAVANARTPVYAIIAGRDLMFRSEWSEELARAGATVNTIQDADHFFNAQAEFEFHDAVLSQIEMIMSSR